MTKVSRIPVDTKRLGFFLNNFWTLITLLENKEQVKDFLKDILSHTEMKMFAKRLQIAKMLLEGYSYQEIRSYVKVTDNTIARISNLIETGAGGLKKGVYALKKIEKTIEENRLRALPNVKEKYGAYFFPEKVIDKLGEQIKKQKKKKSGEKDISL